MQKCKNAVFEFQPIGVSLGKNVAVECGGDLFPWEETFDSRHGRRLYCCKKCGNIIALKPE